MALYNNIALYFDVILGKSLTVDLLKAVIVLLAIAITLACSGALVRAFASPAVEEAQSEVENTDGRGPRVSKKGYDVGTIVGKCENILVILLVISGAVTGLALIFAAKSIVRSEDIKKDPKYYLGGTMVNFTFSFVVAVLAKTALTLLP